MIAIFHTYETAECDRLPPAKRAASRFELLVHEDVPLSNNIGPWNRRIRCLISSLSRATASPTNVKRCANGITQVSLARNSVSVCPPTIFVTEPKAAKMSRSLCSSRRIDHARTGHRPRSPGRASGRKSTSRSMSLSRRISPRAAEPKTDSSLARAVQRRARQSFWGTPVCHHLTFNSRVPGFQAELLSFYIG